MILLPHRVYFILFQPNHPQQPQSNNPSQHDHSLQVHIQQTFKVIIYILKQIGGRWYYHVFVTTCSSDKAPTTKHKKWFWEQEYDMGSQSTSPQHLLIPHMRNRVLHLMHSCILQISKVAESTPLVVIICNKVWTGPWTHKNHPKQAVTIKELCSYLPRPRIVR